MKKMLLTGIAALFLATGAARADDPKSSAEIYCELLKLEGKDYQSCLQNPAVWTYVRPEWPYSDKDAGWPVMIEGDWGCGKISLRRTHQKVNNQGGWDSFHLYSSDGKFFKELPRKIILNYDTHTDRVTINGKPCRKEKQ
jgi:hypothetical protein